MGAFLHEELTEKEYIFFKKNLRKSEVFFIEVFGGIEIYAGKIDSNVCR